MQQPKPDRDVLKKPKMEVVIAGNMMDRKRYNQLQIGKDIRVELHIPPRVENIMTTLSQGSVPKMKCMLV